MQAPPDNQNHPIGFAVYGIAATAGSKQSFPVLDGKGDAVRNKKTGRIITRVKHDNPKTLYWMSHVADKAGQVMEMKGRALLVGPIRLTLTFYRHRPQGHFGTGRNAGKLKASAPELPITRPDTVKLTRAVEDALTGVAWLDDSQVTTHVLQKRYGMNDRVEVLIEADWPQSPIPNPQ